MPRRFQSEEKKLERAARRHAMQLPVRMTVAEVQDRFHACDGTASVHRAALVEELMRLVRSGDPRTVRQMRVDLGLV